MNQIFKDEPLWRSVALALIAALLSINLTVVSLLYQKVTVLANELREIALRQSSGMAERRAKDSEHDRRLERLER